MALDLQPGEYEIDMVYRAAGANAGIAVSAAFILLYLLIVAVPKIKGAARRTRDEKKN